MENLINQLEQLPAKYDELSNIAASTEAKFKNLDEAKKAILAKAELNHPGSTQAETARNGLASTEWATQLAGLAASRYNYLKAKARLDSLSVKLKVLQSLNSNSVAEKRLI